MNAEREMRVIRITLMLELSVTIILSELNDLLDHTSYNHVYYKLVLNSNPLHYFKQIALLIQINAFPGYANSIYIFILFYEYLHLQ